MKTIVQIFSPENKLPLMEQPPHVVILPFPAQGHVKPMLRLAELLSRSRFQITFVNSDHNHARLLSSTNTSAFYSRLPGFRFESLPDGLPLEHPRTGSATTDLFFSTRSVTKPLFRELVISLMKENGERVPPTCIIADGIMSFAIDVAEEVGIPIITFRTYSACCVWVYFHISKLIEEGEIPIQVDKMLDNLVRLRWLQRVRIRWGGSKPPQPGVVQNGVVLMQLLNTPPHSLVHPPRARVRILKLKPSSSLTNPPVVELRQATARAPAGNGSGSSSEHLHSSSGSTKSDQPSSGSSWANPPPPAEIRAPFREIRSSPPPNPAISNSEMTSQDSSSATEENWPIKRCKCHRAQLCIIKRAHTPRNYGRLYYCSTCDNHPICNGFVDWVSDHLKLLFTQCMEDEQMYRRRNGRTTNESRDVQRANTEEEDSANTRVSFEQVELAKLKEQMQDFKFWQKCIAIIVLSLIVFILLDKK